MKGSAKSDAKLENLQKLDDIKQESILCDNFGDPWELR